MERRKTRQRKAVLKAIRELNHPTAQELFEHIIKKERAGGGKQISRGTVYRNLQILYETGKITEITTEVSVTHYDCKLEPHYHARCKKCGSIFDVPLSYIAELNTLAQKATKEAAFYVESHSLVFTGLCKSCVKPIARADAV